MDKDKVIETLDTLSVEELEAVKARVAELLKAKKDEAKESAKAKKEAEKVAHAEAASEALDKSKKQEIRFTLKGAERRAEVVKFTDKTATVDLPEGKRDIKLAAILEVIDLEVAAAAAA